MSEQNKEINLGLNQTIIEKYKCLRKENVTAGEYQLTYQLFETVIDAESFYSITVSIENRYSYQEKTAHDITRIRNKAAYIFDLFVRNSVTPCTVFEILSEIL